MICEPKKISEMTQTCKLLCKDLVPIVQEGENKFILMKDLIKQIVASIGDGDGVDALSIAMYAKNLAEQANANSNQALKDLAVALAYATKAYKLACQFENRLSQLEENYLFLETLEETINNLQRQVSINTLNIQKLFNSKVLRITPEENSNNIVYQFYMDDLLVGEIEVPKYKQYTGGQNIRINGNNVISVYGLHKVANTGNYYDLENLPDLTDFITRSEFEQCCNEVKRRLKVLEDCCAQMHSTFTVTLNLTHMHPTTAYTSTIENGGTFIIGLAPDTNYNNPIVSWAPSDNLSQRTVITPNNGIYKVENITQDITIIGGATEIQPEPVPTYTITYSLGGGISYNTQVSNVVQSGGSYSNEFTLDTGYTNLQASWKGTDSQTHNITLGNNNEFTINNITQNITITASADAPEGTTYTLFITPKEQQPTDLTIEYNNTTITNEGYITDITPGDNWMPDDIETVPPTYDVYFEIYNGQTYEGIISKEDLLSRGISVNANYILKWYLEEKPLYQFNESQEGNRGIFALGTQSNGQLGFQNILLGKINKLNQTTGEYETLSDLTNINLVIETSPNSSGRSIELQNPLGAYINQNNFLVLPIKLYDLTVYSHQEEFQLTIKDRTSEIGRTTIKQLILEAPMFAYADGLRDEFVNPQVQFGKEVSNVLTYPNIIISQNGDTFTSDDSEHPTAVFKHYIAPLGTRNHLIVDINTQVTNNYTEDSKTGFKVNYSINSDPGESLNPKPLTLKVLSSTDWLTVSCVGTLTSSDQNDYGLPGECLDGLKLNIDAQPNSSGTDRIATIQAFLMSDNTNYQTEELENESMGLYCKTITFKQLG